MDEKIVKVLKHGFLRFFYLHILFKNFAIGLFDIFSGIYIYQLLLKNNFPNQSALAYTFLFIGATSLFQFLFIPLSLGIIKKLGLRWAILLGSGFYILYIGVLTLSQFSYYYIWPAALVWGLYASCYWFAYHIYFVEFTKDSLETKEVSIGLNLSILAGLLAPLFGGLVINSLGYPFLFLALAANLIISIIPLSVIPKSYNVSIPFSINDLFKNSFFSQKKNLLGIMGITILQSVFINLWPLYIFPLLANIVFVGLLGTLINLTGIFTNGSIGSIADKSRPKILQRVSMVINFFAWIFASFVTSPIQIFILSLFQSFGSSMRSLLFDANVYENSRHQGMYQQIAQREFGVSLFSALFLFFCAGLVLVGVPFKYLFIISAVIFLLCGSYQRNSN